ncbi:hypothetical protein ACFY3U_24225 [Micromonospora sp. NPDC000089]|uniref:hypothetical protein n=1 Tax=unclassified Micromonospora TaxID=2617518 RepID=UPI0036C8EA67
MRGRRTPGPDEREETAVVQPQQEEFRRNDKGATSQDSKGPGVSGHPANRGHSTGDQGRPVPKGQASPYGPGGDTADDRSSDRG